MAQIVSPNELKKLAEEIEIRKAREALEKSERAESEKKKLHDAFFQREIAADANDRVSDAIRRAAENGLKEVHIVTFPATWTNDKGRRINNNEPDWATSLDGFAKRAYEFYDKEMRAAGYKLRCEVLTFPGGMPGDIGMYLSW